MTKQAIFNKPIILKIPGVKSRYKPTGKKDNTEINTNKIGFLLMETTMPKKQKPAIIIPGIVTIFDALSVEYGLINHKTNHRDKERIQKMEPK